MRRYRVLACIGSYALLSIYDLTATRSHMGVAEVLLVVVNAILFL